MFYSQYNDGPDFNIISNNVAIFSLTIRRCHVIPVCFRMMALIPQQELQTETNS